MTVALIHVLIPESIYMYRENATFMKCPDVRVCKRRACHANRQHRPHRRPRCSGLTPSGASPRRLRTQVNALPCSQFRLKERRETDNGRATLFLLFRLFSNMFMFSCFLKSTPIRRRLALAAFLFSMRPLTESYFDSRLHLLLCSSDQEEFPWQMSTEERIDLSCVSSMEHRKNFRQTVLQ